MDGLISIHERHPPIGHTPIGRIRDVPIGYQADWLGPLLKGPAQAKFWRSRGGDDEEPRRSRGGDEQETRRRRGRDEQETTETTRPCRETTRLPELPPRTSSPPSPVAMGAAPDHPHHHISTNISTRSSVKSH